VSVTALQCLSVQITICVSVRIYSKTSYGFARECKVEFLVESLSKSSPLSKLLYKAIPCQLLEHRKTIVIFI
jgi:hypothetical protein